MFLILIDAHSKWMDVHVMKKITTEATLVKMLVTFANHGFPEVLVTDNGSSFTSQEFKDFTQTAGIRHMFSPQYHPSSNGLAERAVQIFKRGMKAMCGGTIQNRVSRFLFRHRITPQLTTGRSPCELLNGRRLKQFSISKSK